MDIVTTEILPPEASMAGKNTCYCYCPQLNRRSNYGVCLFTLKAFEEERLPADSECHAAISCGGCEAKKYRQQERDAGRALFYKERQIVTLTERPSGSTTTTYDPNSASFKRGWERAGSVFNPKPVEKKPVVKPAPIKSKPKTIEIKTDMSEAISIAVKEEVSKLSKAASATPTPVKQPSAPTQRLSLLERAKLSLQGRTA